MKRKTFALLFLLSVWGVTSYAQISKRTALLTDVLDIDTTTDEGKRALMLYSKIGQVGITGYIQPQFQYAGSKGAQGWAGGNFADNSNNRFLLRRGRLRIDFAHFTADGKPEMNFVFQFDGTERGMAIRDLWGRYYENKWELFHFSAGMMARPFSYELLLPSADRESPERGRMSQILMNTERDLGFMISLNPRKKKSRLKWLNIDAGIYNGQGLTGTAEMDAHKDIVGRISVKPRKIGNAGYLSAGISGYTGGIESRSDVVYIPEKTSIGWQMRYDSAAANKGKLIPRKYAGADAQFIIPNRKGVTQLRAEYMSGLQTATAATSVTPGTYPVNASGANLPLYKRNFNGAYFYFLQHLGSTRHQLVLKYDWYDPNSKVKGKQLTTANGFTAADIKYNTFGAGYIYYLNQYLKVVLYYDRVMNEKTALDGYETDLKDDVFTARVQFSF
ncbi:MAG: porin [Niabella sp.]